MVEYELLIENPCSCTEDNDGNKRPTVEIQVTHVGPDLQFATAEVAKSTAEGLGSASDKGSSADEKQSA